MYSNNATNRAHIIEEELLTDVTDDAASVEEVPPLSWGKRALGAVARFTSNTILSGSLGGYGLTNLIIYGSNDPGSLLTTMWDITQNTFMSPFVFINRATEYTAELATLLYQQKPTTLEEFKILIKENASPALKHMVIDTGLVALAVWIYLSKIDVPDLMELSILNSLITLSRNTLEIPLDYAADKISKMGLFGEWKRSLVEAGQSKTDVYTTGTIAPGI